MYRTQALTCDKEASLDAKKDSVTDESGVNLTAWRVFHQVLPHCTPHHCCTLYLSEPTCLFLDAISS